MHRWMGTLSVQTLTKSYPFEARARVTASRAPTAARLVMEDALAQLGSKVKRRRIESFTLKLTRLGTESRDG